MREEVNFNSLKRANSVLAEGIFFISILFLPSHAFLSSTDECQSSPCKHGGTCKDKVNAYSCACAGGYTGVNCETEIDECASSPCQNGAYCYDDINQYVCYCPAGYMGINCENRESIPRAVTRLVLCLKL